MALNIKDPVAEKLAAEVAGMTGESKTRAIRVSLEERRARLAFGSPRRDRKAAIDEFLRAFWATLPKGVLGKRISKKERERILGYGPHGV